MYYDDNYGAYEFEPGEDPEEVRQFYRDTQRQSVWKICKGCGRRVKIKRDYGICNSCAERQERGMDF